MNYENRRKSKNFNQIEFKFYSWIPNSDEKSFLSVFNLLIDQFYIFWNKLIEKQYLISFASDDICMSLIKIMCFMYLIDINRILGCTVLRSTNIMILSFTDIDVRLKYIERKSILHHLRYDQIFHGHLENIKSCNN